jgi:hypothetical protein
VGSVSTWGKSFGVAWGDAWNVSENAPPPNPYAGMGGGPIVDAAHRKKRLRQRAELDHLAELFLLFWR